MIDLKTLDAAIDDAFAGLLRQAQCQSVEDIIVLHIKLQHMVSAGVRVVGGSDVVVNFLQSALNYETQKEAH
ncbi:MAG: hypothetical protein LCH73_02795 [Proteobacteria bacterium]|nr:hypothetical protein [Pseudomonadota bacterium]